MSILTNSMNSKKSEQFYSFLFSDIFPLQSLHFTVRIHLASFFTPYSTVFIHNPCSDIFRIMVDHQIFHPVEAMKSFLTKVSYIFRDIHLSQLFASKEGFMNQLLKASGNSSVSMGQK